jgi:hypothetical protein
MRIEEGHGFEIGTARDPAMSTTTGVPNAGADEGEGGPRVQVWVSAKFRVGGGGKGF